MTRNVPYLAEEAIECDAEALLAEFSHARDMLIEPPIPIEDIIEKHLKLTIDFDDTHKMFGVPRSGLGFEPDILGALYCDDKRIVIDQSLDPEETPAKEGRYRFTLAHEGGGIGVFIDICLPRKKPNNSCSTARLSRRLSAGPARLRSALSGRRIFTRPVF